MPGTLGRNAGTRSQIFISKDYRDFSSSPLAQCETIDVFQPLTPKHVSNVLKNGRSIMLATFKHARNTSIVLNYASNVLKHVSMYTISNMLQHSRNVKTC